MGKQVFKTNIFPIEYDSNSDKVLVNDKIQSVFYTKIVITLEKSINQTSKFDFVRYFYSDKCGNKKLGHITGTGVGTQFGNKIVAQMQEKNLFFEAKSIFPIRLLSKGERECYSQFEVQCCTKNCCKGAFLIQDHITYTDTSPAYYQTNILGTGVGFLS